MKKTAGKIILIVCCAAVIAFLLLPFLETTAPDKTAGAGKKATPQIFTSNPLTDLVNRIARFFGASRGAQQPPQTLTARQAAEQFGSPEGGEAYADARAAGNYISTEETPDAGRRYNYGDASLQNEEGDWVLIRQTTPDGVNPGMHEVNSQENAYDAYMRQERATRFTPAARMKQRKAVPDSKLARFFNPIKRFFGFDDTEEKLPNADIWDDEQAAVLASSDGFGRMRGLNGSSFARGGNMDIGGIGGGLPDGGSDGQTTNLLSYLDPDAALDQVADFLADSKYPNPKNPQEQKAKEDYRQKRREENRRFFMAKAQERLNRLAAGQEPKDELNSILSGCTGTAPRPVKSVNSCAMPGTKYQPASQDEIQAVKTQNANLFFQKTNKIMPASPIMVVLSRATDIPQENLEGAKEEYLKTREIYDFMLQNEDCSSKPCYWVANAQQNNPELVESVEAAGATFKGDPLGKYQNIKQQFTDYKLAQLPPDAGDDERQQIVNQADEYATSYILYTKDDLKAVQAINRQAMKQRNPGMGAALYSSSAPVGKQLSDDLGTTTFFYGKDDSFIDADQKPGFADRAAVLTENLADQIAFFQQIAQEMKRNAAREVVTDNTRAAAETIQKKSAEDRKAFDKNNNLGAAERGQ